MCCVVHALNQFLPSFLPACAAFIPLLSQVLTGQKYGGKLVENPPRIHCLNQVTEVLKWMEKEMKVSYPLTCFLDGVFYC
jgi:hypothetical protein